MNTMKVMEVVQNFYICHKENYKYKITTKLKEAIGLENKSKINTIKTLKKFDKKINKLKKKHIRCY